MQGPLEGIKVLDLTRVLAGPVCCMLLGDMGAEVVKVERTERGDDVRSVGARVGGESLYFLMMNRNKLGVTLNFRHPQGPSLLKSLVRQADVLVENFRAGTMEKMGCGYEELKKINPRLVMASISGFGQDGPYSDYTCYDMIAQAMSGLMEMTGEPDGPPMTAGSFLIDYSTALYAVIGILGALRAREHTGVGQRIDVALLDTAASFLITAIPEYLLLGNKMTRRGNRDRYCAPANLFQAKDGRWVFIASATDTLFPQLLKVMGREEVLQDPRFATNDARMQNIEAGEALLEEWVRPQTADEVVEKVRGAGLPCAKVATIDEVVKDPQLKHRGMLVEVNHPTAGRVPMHGLNIHFSETPQKIRRAAPLLGQHNEEVYGRWLNLDSSALARLKTEGVI
jgi:crotonobetainyl-CoA:carnitine CoA-transferase CaiB-like acyl-CoA transferase